jgi:hypothetical protein
MTALVVVFGTVGAVLILVGLVGGGFTLSGNVMPTVGKWVRLPCFAVGALLVLLAVGLGVHNTISPSTPTTAVSTPPANQVYPGTIVSSVYVFQSPSLGATRTAELAGGTRVGIECTAQGDVVTNSQYNLTSSLWDMTSLGYIPDVFVDTGTNQATMPTC